jgi:hypothetical protein
MRQVNHMLATGLLALVLVTFSAQQQARAHDAVMLSEQEILAQIIGNTASGASAKHGWSEYYQSDGTIRGRTDDGPYQGKWTLSGSEMCFVYDDSGDVGCWRISVEGDEVTYHKKGKHDMTGTLVKGNPKNH